MAHLRGWCHHRGIADQKATMTLSILWKKGQWWSRDRGCLRRSVADEDHDPRFDRRVARSIPNQLGWEQSPFKRSMYEHQSRKPAISVPAVPQKKKGGNGKTQVSMKTKPGERISQVETFDNIRGGCECEKEVTTLWKGQKPIGGLAWPQKSFSSPPLHAHKLFPPPSGEDAKTQIVQEFDEDGNKGLKIREVGKFDFGLLIIKGGVVAAEIFPKRSLKIGRTAREGARVQKKGRVQKLKIAGLLDYWQPRVTVPNHTANFTSWVSSQ